MPRDRENNPTHRRGGIHTLWGCYTTLDGACPTRVMGTVVGAGPGHKGRKVRKTHGRSSQKKKMTLPLSGASNRLSVTSRQRKGRITSHDKDTARKDSTFTQERRASAQHSAATILPDMAGGSRDPRAPLLYSYCDDCYKRAPLLNCKVETTRL